MPANEEANWSLIDFARRVAAMPATRPEANCDSIEPTPVSDKSTAALTPANDSNGFSENPQPISKERDAVPAVLQNTQPAEVIEPRTSGIKELRTSNQIARMILAKLHAIDRCPDRGFFVTVYGSNPWNAMLTIKPEAGPVINHLLWRSRVQEIGMQLRDDFDITQETNASGV